MDSTEHIFPVPPVIEIPELDRRSMDAHVDAFPATQHGYRIRVGHSKAGSHLCHYECHRSGFAPLKVNANTKSLRIGCPFRLSARFLPHNNSWLLVHTHLAHNHPADPQVTIRKKTSVQHPILPHPHHLSRTEDDQQAEDTPPTTHAEPVPQPQHQHRTPINSSLPQPLIDPPILALSSRLQALTPTRKQQAILDIERILANQEASASTLPVELTPVLPKTQVRHFHLDFTLISYCSIFAYILTNHLLPGRDTALHI